MDEKDREIQELRRQVESLKTEVVKRGKWLEGSRVVRVYACSVCGWELYEKTDFCPHCGRTCTSWRGCK